MASAYLSKTAAGAGNNTTGTLSLWFKRSGEGGATQRLYQHTTDSDHFMEVGINGSDRIFMYSYDNPTNVLYLLTNARVKDYGAWYHLVCAFDSTQGTNTNRAKMYVNGNQITDFNTSTYPSQNADLFFNKSGQTQYVASNYQSGYRWDGLIAHLHWADGQQYAASNFGEFDSNGVWTPKTSPTLSYGTNGHFLKFDNSANMGLDSSGQTNNFTTSGSVVQTKDTPSFNQTTFNSIDNRFDDTTLTNCSLTMSGGRISTGFDMIRATFGADSGKWYYEMKAADLAEIDQVGIGIQNGVSMQNEGASGFNGNVQGYGVQMSNVYKAGVGQSGAAYMGAFSAGDICMVAVDLDNDKITFGRNGQWANGSGAADQTYANSTAAFTGLSDVRGYVPMFANRNSGNNNTGVMHFNFGNGQFGTSNVASAGSNGNGFVFEYDVPTGFYAWNTKNLKDQS